jgi:hypothetical protein
MSIATRAATIDGSDVDDRDMGGLSEVGAAEFSGVGIDPFTLIVTSP